MADSSVNVDALKSDVRSAIINQKANACPMVIRLAWHAAGTFDVKDGSGGTNGATMVFEPESSDPANAGLHIVRSMLMPVKANHPEISVADLWVFSGFSALEFLGGPKINAQFGRRDHKDGSFCPTNGRLPDASQGAEHIRKVFYRMGFNDREIVALSGAHTLGRCHIARSGYDGPWTRNPLKFDNSFFKNLLYLEWKPKEWNGPLQYEDVETGELMMLPTDMALRTDPKFRVFAEMYAKDQDLFFKDFAEAFSKLLNLGVPPVGPVAKLTPQDKAGIDFREAAMHGSYDTVKKLAGKADVHQAEKSSGRTALHKAAFWGHEKVVRYLLDECKLDVNATDYNGDTPLHDAVKFSHPGVVEILLASKPDLTLKNKQGKDAMALAVEFGYDKIVALLKGIKSKL